MSNKANEQRLLDLKSRCDALQREVSLAQLQLETLEAEEARLVQECRERFNCTPDELPALIERLEQEAVAALAEAEQLLGQVGEVLRGQEITHV